jgi:hypothetical protein
VGSVVLDLRWSLERAKKAVLLSLAAQLPSTALPVHSPACQHVAAGVSERAVEEAVGRVHVRKTSKGAQVKDETKALGELGLAAGSLLFVRSGAPRSPTQTSLKVFLVSSAASLARPLLALTVEQSWTVAELKSALAIRLSKSKDKAVSAGVVNEHHNPKRASAADPPKEPDKQALQVTKEPYASPIDRSCRCSVGQGGLAARGASSRRAPPQAEEGFGGWECSEGRGRVDKGVTAARR